MGHDYRRFYRTPADIADMRQYLPWRARVRWAFATRIAWCGDLLMVLADLIYSGE